MRHSMTTPEIYAEWKRLVARHPEAFETTEETWLRSCRAIDAFGLQNGRLPSKKAKEPAEKRLGQWVTTQKRSYAAVQYIMKKKAFAKQSQ